MLDKLQCEYDLQYVVIRDCYSSNNLVVPNIGGGYGEIDVLKLTRSGYTYEYEIKISKNDFKADNKKIEKHQNYSDVYNNIPRLWWGGKSKDREGIPNYFIYVAPKGIIPIEKIPDYAGFYEIDNNYLKCIKKAPKIHREKHWNYWVGKIARSLNAKYLYHYWLKLKPKVDAN
jgi:hypothetical protein